MRVDLTTSYLGLELRHPIVAGASPLTGNLDSLKRLEQAGVAAVVLPSLFEEQIVQNELQLDALYEYNAGSYAESLTYFPELREYNTGPRDYIKLLKLAKKSLHVPVVASLNGSSPGGWVRFAKQLEDAGADAIELNIYFVPTDPRMAAADVERRYANLVSLVKRAVSVPVAVKIGAQFSSLCHFARQLADVGADGLVMFNRYLEPDINLSSLQIMPHLVLSTRNELRLPLRWIGILRDQTSMSLAATSGIHFPEDAVKLILVGADVCMMTSALFKHGVEYVSEMVRELENWFEINDYVSVEQAKGSMSYCNCPDSGQLERANYMKAITTYAPLR
jgi:dihydroorotate dehydrogenase (fumarate)